MLSREELIEALQSSSPQPTGDVVERLVFAAERVANKYGRDPQTDEPLDWTEWQNLRDYAAEARAALTAMPEPQKPEEAFSTGTDPIARIYGAADAVSHTELVTVQGGDLKALVAEHRSMPEPSVESEKARLREGLRKALISARRLIDGATLADPPMGAARRRVVLDEIDATLSERE